MKKTLTVLSLLALSACTLLGQESRRISVSPEASRSLKRVSGHLRAADAEMQLRCDSATSCVIEIDGSRQPKIQAELIQHPFEDRPLAYRVHGGTQALQGALYEALGEQVPTTDFQGRVDQRVLQLDTDAVKFRCTATREAKPVYECWTIVAARVLK